MTNIAFSSQALVRIGAAPITSFSDGTAESEIAGTLYDTVRDGLLSSYGWSFASRQAALSQLAQDPAADYQFAFGLPSDFLRALSAGTNTQSRGVNFRIANGALHTNVSAVTLNYVARINESAFPSYFVQVLITRLAAEFCIPVTENTSRAEALYRLAEREAERARQIDAQQDSPQRLENFTLTDVRH